MSARVLELHETAGEAVGGKASGLRELVALGLPVPEAFVVMGAEEGQAPDALFERYRRMGAGLVAVRSSAVGEDGEDASFAGQYETVLNVEGDDALRDALDHCLRSVQSARANAYADAKGDGATEPPAMSVVVQRMVTPRAAGVLFTVDPVTGRRDRLIIDAVLGLGEALVSGEATPDHYELDANDNAVVSDLLGDTPILSQTELTELARRAREASRAFGGPLDMEWAIDGEGVVHFLQARPVTQLSADPRALDVQQAPGDYYTKANIGEMMPGAVTPLTQSMTARGIDVGMQHMFSQCGAQRHINDEFTLVGVSFGHMFLNLSYVAGMSRFVLGSTAEQAIVAICGRHLPEVEAALDKPKPLPLRAFNLLRYAYFMGTAYRRVPTFRALVDGLTFAPGQPARTQWDAIEARVPDWIEAFVHHLAGSSPAGAMAPTLLRMTAENDPPTEQDFARVAELLAGAEDVESADIAAGIDRVVDALDDTPGADALFAEASPEEALRYIRGASAGKARTAFADYLERHGHRAVRELELRQPEWAEDPLPLIRSIQTNFRARLSGAAMHRAGHYGVDVSTLPGSLRRVVEMAHKAVRLREETKSLLVRAGQRFKQAYRDLGAQLALEGRLPDADAVFFLQHEELGELTRADETRAAELARLAVARRKTHAWQMSLVFEEVFRGWPEPLRPAQLVASADGEVEVRGKPVSVGVVRGRARVVRTLAEAEAVEPGEVLIAPITDVGWTPLFSIIGGLATDVGSAVSHGAVVAREYGLPCIVNTQVGTTSFCNGDLVELDGATGVIRRISDADA